MLDVVNVSTIAAATRASRPFSSAADSNAARTAEIVFSSATSPVPPSTGVAAPSTAPGVM